MTGCGTVGKVTPYRGAPGRASIPLKDQPSDMVTTTLIAESDFTRLREAYSLIRQCMHQRGQIVADYLFLEVDGVGGDNGSVTVLRRPAQRGKQISERLANAGSCLQNAYAFVIFMIVTDGGFRPDGTFMHWPAHDTANLTEAFRRAVLKLFVDVSSSAPSRSSMREAATVALTYLLPRMERVGPACPAAPPRQ